MMMSHAYTPLSLVEGEAFFSMVTCLGPYIRLINRSKLTRTLIPEKSKRVETDVSTFIDGVSCVFVSYDIWMLNTTQNYF